MKRKISLLLLVAAFSAVSFAQNALPKCTARLSVSAYTKSIVHPFVDHKFFSVGVPSMIAVSDFINSDINVYDDSGTLQATLTSGLANPQGLATDRMGNLYVANSGGRNILIWGAGFGGPPIAIADPDGEPADVDVRDNGAFLGVTNIIGDNGASVTFYRNGNRVGNVTDPGFEMVYFGAFDKGGSFYFDGINVSGEVFVAVIAHANTGGRTVQYLTTDNTLGFPGGVQVNNDGTISIGNQAGLAIYTYNPPSGGSLGAPISTTVLGGSVDPVTFAFKIHNRNLYTADVGTLSANEFAYPAGGNPENVITISGAAEPIGVAITPAQMPLFALGQ
jgi:hypothetical protein